MTFDYAITQCSVRLSVFMCVHVYNNVAVLGPKFSLLCSTYVCIFILFCREDCNLRRICAVFDGGSLKFVMARRPKDGTELSSRLSVEFFFFLTYIRKLRKKLYLTV